MFAKMKWGDFLVIGIVLVVCVALWLNLLTGFNTNNSICEVVTDGTVILKFDLSTGEKTFQIDNVDLYVDSITEDNIDSKTQITIENHGIHFSLLISNGRIRFLESDCPDQICVQTGNIYRSGEISACVPANVLIRIVKQVNSEDPDFIAG